MKIKYSKVVALTLIPQILIVKFIGGMNETVENLYSMGFYPMISDILNHLTAWIPFSIGDIIYTLFFFSIIYWGIKNRREIVKKPSFLFYKTMGVFAVVHFLFYTFWGLNYYRLSLPKKMSLKQKFTLTELVQTTEKIVYEANKIHRELVVNDSLKVSEMMTLNEIFNNTENGFGNVNTEFNFLIPNYLEQTKIQQFKLKNLNVKRSIFSHPLSYMGFSGYFNPFTNEAQINTMGPMYSKPTTVCHEIAHQIGFASENEANFIGYLAAINNDSAYFKYSANLFALQYCLRDIYKRDKNQYDQVLKKINKGILKNFEESRNYWIKHQNPIEPMFKNVYNFFLKANNQKKGIESYHDVVVLIVNYHQKKSFN